MSEKDEVSTPEVKQAKSSILGSIMIFIAMTALVIFAGAFAYGYFELSKVNTSLARMVDDLRKQVNEQQNRVVAMQESLQTHAANQPAEAVAAQADLNKFYVMEAQSLTKIASNHLNVTRDASMAYVVLQHAQQVLQQVSSPAVDPVRQALAANLVTLNGAQQVNFDQIYGQLTQIYNSIDQLQLPSTPLTQTTNAAEPAKNYSDAPWWKRQWHKTMDMLRKIVIVRYNDGNNMPLVLPEEKMFLYQNLHAQIEVAMLGLMNRNQTVYSGGLEQARVWIQHYFQPDEPLTKEIVSQLQMLQAINIVPPQVDLNTTLQLFNQYLAQNHAASEQPAVTQGG